MTKHHHHLLLTPAVRIQKARTALLLDHPFFGSLLFRLGGRASNSIQTMATDGASLFYNPQFVETLSAAELAGVLAHEVMHPALQHHTRRGDRERKRWNMACDYAINPLLLDAGLTLPKDVLVDHRFRGMSAERIYNLIEEEQDQGDSNGDREDNDSASSGGRGRKEADDTSADGEPTAPTTAGGFGQVLDAPEPEGDDDAVAEQAREWKIAVEQAENVARLAGKLPAGVTRSLEQSEAAGVDWRELLRRSWSETIPSDYIWMPPNRRHIWSGLYLPGIKSEGTGEIAIAVDCSGSVNARHLGLFEAEIRSILEGQRPSRVHVLYFDAEVHKVECYEAGQPVTLAPVGGGGTDFRPCFHWLEERGIVPQTLVFLTDLCGRFPNDVPPYPVLWASTETHPAPFGQVISLAGA
jgi:predicted metal-dependent peptidase